MAALARLHIQMLVFNNSLLPKPLHTPAEDVEEENEDDEDNALESTFTSVRTLLLFAHITKQVKAVAVPPYGRRQGYIPRNPEVVYFIGVC